MPTPRAMRWSSPSAVACLLLPLSLGVSAGLPAVASNSFNLDTLCSLAGQQIPTNTSEVDDELEGVVLLFVSALGKITRKTPAQGVLVRAFVLSATGCAPDGQVSLSTSDLPAGTLLAQGRVEIPATTNFFSGLSNINPHDVQAFVPEAGLTPLSDRIGVSVIITVLREVSLADSTLPLLEVYKLQWSLFNMTLVAAASSEHILQASGAPSSDNSLPPSQAIRSPSIPIDTASFFQKHVTPLRTLLAPNTGYQLGDVSFELTACYELPTVSRPEPAGTRAWRVFASHNVIAAVTDSTDGPAVCCFDARIEPASSSISPPPFDVPSLLHSVTLPSIIKRDDVARAASEALVVDIRSYMPCSRGFLTLSTDMLMLPNSASLASLILLPATLQRPLLNGTDAPVSCTILASPGLSVRDLCSSTFFDGEQWCPPARLPALADTLAWRRPVLGFTPPDVLLEAIEHHASSERLILSILERTRDRGLNPAELEQMQALCGDGSLPWDLARAIAAITIIYLGCGETPPSLLPRREGTPVVTSPKIEADVSVAASQSAERLATLSPRTPSEPAELLSPIRSPEYLSPLADSGVQQMAPMLATVRTVLTPFIPMTVLGMHEVRAAIPPPTFDEPVPSLTVPQPVRLPFDSPLENNAYYFLQTRAGLSRSASIADIWTVPCFGDDAGDGTALISFLQRVHDKRQELFKRPRPPPIHPGQRERVSFPGLEENWRIALRTARFTLEQGLMLPLMGSDLLPSDELLSLVFSYLASLSVANDTYATLGGFQRALFCAGPVSPCAEFVDALISLAPQLQGVRQTLDIRQLAELTQRGCLSCSISSAMKLAGLSNDYSDARHVAIGVLERMYQSLRDDRRDLRQKCIEQQSVMCF